MFNKCIFILTKWVICIKWYTKQSNCSNTVIMPSWLKEDNKTHTKYYGQSQTGNYANDFGSTIYTNSEAETRGCLRKNSQGT